VAQVQAPGEVSKLPRPAAVALDQVNDEAGGDAGDIRR
jgi:hypothetical protein